MIHVRGIGIFVRDRQSIRLAPHSSALRLQACVAGGAGLGTRLNTCEQAIGSRERAVQQRTSEHARRLAERPWIERQAPANRSDRPRNRRQD